MLQSFALAVLALARRASPSGRSSRLQLLQGLINAFDMPARQAFVVEMVEDRADLRNAIALNSSMVNGARLLGPVDRRRAHRRGGRGLVLRSSTPSATSR